MYESPKGYLDKGGMIKRVLVYIRQDFEVFLSRCKRSTSRLLDWFRLMQWRVIGPYRKMSLSIGSTDPLIRSGKDVESSVGRP